MSPILHQSDVVNNLSSTSTTTPLSAAMGTALNSTLTRVISKGAVLIDYDTNFKSNYLTNSYGAWMAHYGYIYIVSGYFQIKSGVTIPGNTTILKLNMPIQSRIYGTISTSDNKTTRYTIDDTGIMYNENPFNTNNVWGTFTSVLIKK